jgi:hypothetical protein
VALLGRLNLKLSLSTLFEVKFSTLFDVGLRLSEGLSECAENLDSLFKAESKLVPSKSSLSH